MKRSVLFANGSIINWTGVNVIETLHSLINGMLTQHLSLIGVR
jgi:hypothetical protein